MSYDRDYWNSVLGVLIASPLIIAFDIFLLLLVYGVVVIIFRYAFGVELWNPFSLLD